jgi:predicted dehydrogenase
MKQQIGVIGCGWAGLLHLEAYQDCPNAEIAAVCDTNLATAERAKARYKGKAYRDVEAMLKAEELDVVSICTGPDTHYEISRACLERQLAIFCEKPLTRTVEEAQTLVRLVEKKKVRFGVNFNSRFSAPYQKAKQWIEGDRVHYISVTLFEHVPLKDSLNVREEFLVTDAACHLFDLMRFLNGEIVEIYATLAKLGLDIWSDINVHCRFENGNSGTLAISFAGGELESQHPIERAEIVTNRKRVVVDNICERVTMFPHAGENREVWEPSVFQRQDYQATILESVRAWMQSIVEESVPPIGIADGARAAALCQAILDSHRTHAPITVAS